MLTLPSCQQMGSEYVCSPICNMPCEDEKNDAVSSIWFSVIFMAIPVFMVERFFRRPWQTCKKRCKIKQYQVGFNV